MAEEKVLAEGLRKFSPHANAPDFVKGTLVISPRLLLDWIKAHPEFLTDYNGEKQIKLQELESKSGNPYFVVDTWKPEQKAATTTKSTPERDNFKQSLSTKLSNANDDDLPF